MKIGVKTFDDPNFLKHFENKVDFFEIEAIQKNDYSFLRKFSLPMVIHAEHGRFGVNPADFSKKDFNLNSIKFAIKLADLTNARKIIVHPGEIEKGNENCSLENSIDFFNEINDERILIENLPPSRNPKITRLCQTPRQIKEFMKETGTGFCFDVNHTSELEKEINRRYNFIKKYIELNPAHYHLGGQKFNGETHFSFLNSDLNLKETLKFYPDNAEITLETEVDMEKTEEDIRIIKGVLKELGNKIHSLTLID